MPKPMVPAPKASTVVTGPIQRVGSAAGSADCAITTSWITPAHSTTSSTTGTKASTRAHSRAKRSAASSGGASAPGGGGGGDEPAAGTPCSVASMQALRVHSQQAKTNIHTATADAANDASRPSHSSARSQSANSPARNGAAAIA